MPFGPGAYNFFMTQKCQKIKPYQQILLTSSLEELRKIKNHEKYCQFLIENIKNIFSIKNNLNQIDASFLNLPWQSIGKICRTFPKHSSEVASMKENDFVIFDLPIKKL